MKVDKVCRCHCRSWSILYLAYFCIFSISIIISALKEQCLLTFIVLLLCLCDYYIEHVSKFDANYSTIKKKTCSSHTLGPILIKMGFYVSMKFFLFSLGIIASRGWTNSNSHNHPHRWQNIAMSYHVNELLCKSLLYFFPLFQKAQKETNPSTRTSIEEH